MDFYLIFMFWFDGALATERMPEPFDSYVECTVVGDHYTTPAEYKGIVVRYQCSPDGKYFSQSEFENIFKESP
jgi:hypothetical protein